MAALDLERLRALAERTYAAAETYLDGPVCRHLADQTLMLCEALPALLARLEKAERDRNDARALWQGCQAAADHLRSARDSVEARAERAEQALLEIAGRYPSPRGAGQIARAALVVSREERGEEVSEPE